MVDGFNQVQSSQLNQNVKLQLTILTVKEINVQTTFSHQWIKQKVGAGELKNEYIPWEKV